MQFFICSDLHIEKTYPTVPKVKEIFKGVDPNSRLILNGDVGRLEYWEQYISFISACCSYFQSVFLVLGNHEYYVQSDVGLGMDELLSKIKTLTLLHDNLQILDNSYIVLSHERLVIFGSTFWSFYPVSNESPQKDDYGVFRTKVELAPLSSVLPREVPKELPSVMLQSVTPLGCANFVLSKQVWRDFVGVEDKDAFFQKVPTSSKTEAPSFRRYQKFPNVPINLSHGRRITASSWNALHFIAKVALERAIH